MSISWNNKSALITIFTTSPTCKHISFKWSVPIRFTERTLTPVKGAQEVTDTRHTSYNKLAKKPA